MLPPNVVQCELCCAALRCVALHCGPTQLKRRQTAHPGAATTWPARAMRQTKEQILQSNCPRHATCPAAKCGALQQADVCTYCTAASDEQNKPVWQPKAAASHRCLPEPVPFSCRPEPQATEFEFEFDMAAAWVMRPPFRVAWVASGLVSRSLHCRRRGAEPTRQVRLAARPERLARPWPHYPLARADQTPPKAPLHRPTPARPGLPVRLRCPGQRGVLQVRCGATGFTEPCGTHDDAPGTPEQAPTSANTRRAKVWCR